MKKFWKIWFVALLAMLLSGCVMRTVDQLYCLPQRPPSDDELQEVVDRAMSGMSYSAPVRGENRQTLQSADLDGDGVAEYVALARDGMEKSLKILIFKQVEKSYCLTDTIEGYGTIFDFLEFAEIDGRLGMEMVVGRRAGDSVVGSATVYRYAEGKAEQMLEVSYAKLLTGDINDDGKQELLVIPPVESTAGCSAMFYCHQDGRLSCTSRIELDVLPENVKRVEQIRLEDGRDAVIITCIDNDVQTMEVFCCKTDSAVLRSVYGPVEVDKLGTHFLYPTDADGDGKGELPEIIPIRTLEGEDTGEYWIRWYGLYSDGRETNGMYTYYNYAQRWYVHMDQTWLYGTTVTRTEDVCTFYDASNQLIMSIYSLTGSKREQEAERLDGTILGRNQTTTYVALTGPGAIRPNITGERIKQLFYPVGLDLITEE